MGKLKAVFWIFLVVGPAMLIGAGLLAQRTRSFLAEAVSTTGTVLELDWRRSDNGRVAYPVVAYQTADGQELTFRSNTGSNPPAYEPGDAVQVLYSPARPRDARLSGTFSLWGGSIILGGLGAVFSLIGAGGLLGTTFLRRRKDQLRQAGTRVLAQCLGVEQNTAYTFNGRHPWRIAAQWQDPRTGLLHVFHSENLWFDPTPYVDRKELTVFVDPTNPKRHLVDVSFLPKLAA